MLFCDLIGSGRGLGSFIKIFKDIFSISDKSIKILNMFPKLSDSGMFYNSDGKCKLGLSYYDEKGTKVQLPLYEFINFLFPVPFDGQGYTRYCTIPWHPSVNWCNNIVYNNNIDATKFEHKCFQYINVSATPQANTFG